MNFGGWELIAILFIVLLLFGSSRLPQLAKGMGKSIREFKKGIAEGDEELPAGTARAERLRSGEEGRLREEEELEDEKISLNKRR